MDAAAPLVDSSLPADVPTLQAMVRELLARNQQLEARIAELTAKLDAALKHRFGRRSDAAHHRPRPPPGSRRPGAMNTDARRCPNISNVARSSTT